jgi:hypothetical protein
VSCNILTAVGSAVTGFWVEMGPNNQILDRGTVNLVKDLDFDVMSGNWDGVDAEGNYITGPWGLIKLNTTLGD